MTEEYQTLKESPAPKTAQQSLLDRSEAAREMADNPTPEALSAARAAIAAVINRDAEKEAAGGPKAWINPNSGRGKS